MLLLYEYFLVQSELIAAKERVNKSLKSIVEEWQRLEAEMSRLDVSSGQARATLLNIGNSFSISRVAFMRLFS